MRRSIPIYIIAALTLIAGGAMRAEAQTQRPVSDIGVRDVSYTRNNGYMTVDMEVDLRDLDVRSKRAVLITPGIVNGRDTLDLYSLGVYGRQRYYYYVRNGASMLTGITEESYRESHKPSYVRYHTEVPYAEWMNGSHLVIMRQEYGCCSSLVDEEVGALGAGYKQVEYMPEFKYKRPAVADQKSYSLSGRAFIDFPVNRTELYPDYRGNRSELAKIIATIDSVRGDRDVTITALSIKGFASPEGKYENNIRLAKGRTETLRNYVQRLYNFAPGFIRTDYEPEDWAGLREYVQGSMLEHKIEILDIINDPVLEPDTKDWRIKLRYPDEYKFLLATVYPALRHSDYQISYTVRGYSSIEEIKEIIKTAPQKLSLNEMFLLAQTYESGSEEFNEVFETAVRMFPDDETANLNAANAAMTRKDYASAARYLSKAGSGAEVTYARGVLSALQGDYESAERYVSEAQRQGLSDAGGVLEHIREVRKYGPQNN